MLNNVIGVLATPTLPVTNSYESIQTFTAGSGGSSAIDFTVIPSTYKHLQIRAIARSTFASAADGYKITFNNAGGSSYSYHLLIGTGSGTPVAAANSSAGFIIIGDLPANTAPASTFGATVIDVLDYTNTNKFKTLRSLTGDDVNGGGSVRFASGLYQATTAVTSIKLESFNGGNFAQHSSFALYGIKG